MDEQQLHRLIGSVKSGELSRRRFIEMMAGFGLSVPFAFQMLLQSGIVSAAVRPAYKPTRRGGGGPLKLLLWQAPTSLNPHFATGDKDQYAARIFYEPLADWDAEGNLVPILASEAPSLENGMVARDGRSVTWKLKTGVQWHDGKPFTADDVVFTAEYAADPAAATVSIGLYSDSRVEKIDAHTVRVVFQKPTPAWARAFVGAFGMILPRHHFDAYRGAKSREAPLNLKAVGTGPYKFSSFAPGDSVRAVINPNYHEPNRPYFDTLEMKGGGDAVSAARAVLQTGEYDYAWNVQIEDEILKRLEQGGKGVVSIVPAATVEQISLNAADPWTEVAGERSSAKSRHPVFSDDAVREAFSLLVDRASIQKYIYGRTGIATANFLNYPEKFRSRNTKFEFNIDKANKVLDAAAWKRGPDGIRGKDGRKLQFVFQTTTNAPRQKTQAIIKQACQKAGIELELKSIPASVFFSSDYGNPDTVSKFFSDIQMFAWTGANPDPQRFMDYFCSWEIPNRENKWIGRNVSRWHSDAYDQAFRAAQAELDPVKRAAIFIRMNDLVIEGRYIIPIVNRPTVVALARRLRAPLSGFSSDLYLLQDWYMEA